jgi:hypothetical protein
MPTPMSKLPVRELLRVPSGSGRSRRTAANDVVAAAAGCGYSMPMQGPSHPTKIQHHQRRWRQGDGQMYFIIGIKSSVCGIRLIIVPSLLAHNLERFSVIVTMMRLLSKMPVYAVLLHEKEIMSQGKQLGLPLSDAVIGGET